MLRASSFVSDDYSVKRCSPNYVVGRARLAQNRSGLGLLSFNPVALVASSLGILTATLSNYFRLGDAEAVSAVHLIWPLFRSVNAHSGCRSLRVRWRKADSDLILTQSYSLIMNRQRMP